MLGLGALRISCNSNINNNDELDNVRLPRVAKHGIHPCDNHRQQCQGHSTNLTVRGSMMTRTAPPACLPPRAQRRWLWSQRQFQFRGHVPVTRKSTSNLLCSFALRLRPGILFMAAKQCPLKFFQECFGMCKGRFERWHTGALQYLLHPQCNSQPPKRLRRRCQIQIQADSNHWPLEPEPVTVLSRSHPVHRWSPDERVRSASALPGRHQLLRHYHCCIPDAEEAVVDERRLRFCQAAQKQRVAQFQLHGPAARLWEDPRAQWIHHPARRFFVHFFCKPIPANPAALRPALFCSPAYCAACRPALMCSPLARPVIQLASLRIIHVFHWATWSSSPLGPPALRLVLSVATGVSLAEMSELWNFSIRVQSWSDEIESDPFLIRKIFENHQSNPVLICPCEKRYSYFASWGTLLELFCLYPNTIAWRQNSSSIAAAS